VVIGDCRYLLSHGVFQLKQMVTDVVRGPRERSEARTTAATAGATTLVDAADRLPASFNRGRQAEPWHPLSTREFEVA
jgi:hypothetical protein